MNIDQYRAMKAKMEAQANEPKIEEKPVEQQKVETKQEQKEEQKTEVKEVIPDKIIVEGIGEVSLDELKRGYLRTQDYTKKTQELAKQRKEAEQALQLYEGVRKNPELASEIAKQVQMSELDPYSAKIIELENKLYDMMLQNEIKELQNKYQDFEIREVLEVARDKNITNLEDAYLLIKSRKGSNQNNIDVNSLKEQIRQELLKELSEETEATKTIISSENNDVIVQDNTPKISEAEKRVAINMFKKEKDPIGEYIKWRDMNKKSK